MSGPAPVVWLQSLGGEELEAAREAAEQAARVRVVDTVAAAERLLRESPARLLMIAQPRRGVWSQDDCDRLHQAAPLTRLVGVHGSCCEGWQRTGHPWRGVEHLYWHQLAARMPVLLHGAPPPRTTTLQESLRRPQAPAAARPGRAAMSAPDRATREALADALRTLGWELAAPGAPGCGAAIWDGDPRSASDLARLEQLVAKHPDLPRLALTVAPRIGDWRLLQQHVELILTKPFSLEDLLWWRRWRMAADGRGA